MKLVARLEQALPIPLAADISITATGKVVGGQPGKRHGIMKPTTKFIRDARGTTTLSAPDAKIVKGYMPYDR